jgi:methionine aminopeptidase
MLAAGNWHCSARRKIPRDWQCYTKACKCKWLLSCAPLLWFVFILNSDLIFAIRLLNLYSIIKGHGIHRLFHTQPNVPHYAKNKTVGVMKAGNTFTIEPMINAGNHADDQWPDGWTAVTTDGRMDCQS